MIEVNYLAILLAAVASMAVGFAWYSPALFGKPWMRLMGYSPESLKKAQKEMGKLYGMSFVVALITAYVLNHVMALSTNFYHYAAIPTGLTTAFWMWLGFIMPVQFADAIFAKDRHKEWIKLLGIHTGFQLVSLLVMGVIIGALM